MISNTSENTRYAILEQNHPNCFSCKIAWYYLREKVRLDDCQIMNSYDLAWFSVKFNIDSEYPGFNSWS